MKSVNFALVRFSQLALNSSYPLLAVSTSAMIDFYEYRHRKILLTILQTKNYTLRELSRCTDDRVDLAGRQVC